MVKNENYEAEIKLYHEGKLRADQVGILGWHDETRRVSVHDAVARYNISKGPKVDTGMREGDTVEVQDAL